WDFGDGTTGSGRQTSHIYEDEGSYTVRLIVKSDTGQESDPYTETVEVEAVRWRYEVSLEVAGAAAGKRTADDPVEAEVGDTVLVKVRVENTGAFPLEDIHVPAGPDGIEILSDGNEIPLGSGNDQIDGRGTINRSETRSSDDLIMSYPTVKTGDFTVWLKELEATSVKPTTGERKTVKETAVACAVGEKRAGSQAGDEENQGCAQGTVKAA